MHAETYTFLATAWDRHVRAEFPTVLEIGSRDVNGRCSDAVRWKYHTWTGVDVEPGSNVDLVADATLLRLDRLFDVVVCTSVFEHTPCWPSLVYTARAHLPVGGLLLASCPAPGFPVHSALYEGPPYAWEWYENVDHERLAKVAQVAGFEVLESYRGGAWGCEAFLVARAVEPRRAD